MTIGSTGVETFTFSPTTPITGDPFITSTATPTVIDPNAYLSTIGFSTAIQISAAPEANADLSVVASPSPNPVAPGGSLLFQITVKNNGPDAAAGVSFTGAVPAGTTFSSFNAPSGWSATTPQVGQTGAISASIASLAAGDSATFSLIVQVSPSATNGQVLTNVSSVTTTTADSNSANDSNQASATVQISEAVSPTQTVLASSQNPATVGGSVTFTATVSASSTSTQPGGFVTFAIDGVNQPSVSVSSLAAGGVGAQISTSGLGVGSHTITATYAGDANFASSTSNSVVEVINAQPTGSGPGMVMMQRFGFHSMPTTIVLTFDRALDVSAAQDLRNYRIVDAHGKLMKIGSAVYNSTAHTVTLHPRERLSLHARYMLTINGSPSHGVRDLAGRLLDSSSNGTSGGNHTIAIVGKDLVFRGSASAHRASTRRKT